MAGAPPGRPKVTNIHSGAFVAEGGHAGQTWCHLDLDGARLGARIEALHPGETSSVHHWHTQEEEHVLLLDGTLTLVLGPEDAREKVELCPGDHVCFHAGAELAHHLANRGEEPARYLVFGERLPGDVVVYPDAKVMMVKEMDRALFTYRPFTLPEATGDDA